MIPRSRGLRSRSPRMVRGHSIRRSRRRRLPERFPPVRDGLSSPPVLSAFPASTSSVSLTSFRFHPSVARCTFGVCASCSARGGGPAPGVVGVPASISRCITRGNSYPVSDRFGEPCRLIATLRKPAPWCSFQAGRIRGRVSSRVSIRLRCASRPATWRSRRFRRFVRSSQKWRQMTSSGPVRVRRVVETLLVRGTISLT